MRGFKNLGQLFIAALGVGMNVQMLRRLHRATSLKVKHGRYFPHQGKRECARRRRQRAAGMLRFHSYEERP